MSRKVCEVLLDVPNSDLARETLIPQSTILPCPGEPQRAAEVLIRGGKIAILAGDGCRGAREELILPPKLDAAHAWGYSLAKLKELFVEEESG